jgi:hypothetical protein
MYLHDYRWSAGFTSQELSVVRKALNIAAFEDAEPLDEKEGLIAENLARIIGGVYAAKRAEREERRSNEDGGEDRGQHQHFVPRQNDRQPSTSDR